MPSERPSSYLRLSQFLDLESRWRDIRDRDRLCHQICQSIVILLDTPAAAIGCQRPDGRYRILASAGDWPDGASGPAAPASSLLRRSLAAGTPQLKSQGESSVGIFPFPAPGGVRGCLHVRIARSMFEAIEVSFLRFLASLTGIMIGAGEPAAAPATAGVVPSSATVDDARTGIAMAVHDLRNPLSVLSGFAELLDSGELGELTDDQRRAVRAIVRQSGILTDAVDRLLDLEREPATSEPLQSSPFDLRALFEELDETRFVDAGDRIRWPGPESAFAFTTDRRRLLSVVQNLVENALEHGGGGEVTVECTREHQELVVEVTDRGPGLDPRLRAALAGSHGSWSGTGLGLRTVASHVRALGATLSVTDREGGGTVVEVRIPSAGRSGADGFGRRR